MNREILLKELDAILSLIKEKITDDSDMVWTRFDAPQQLLQEIDNVFLALQNSITYNSIYQLEMLFGPTASLQEHSITNGWGNEFIILAEKIDTISANLKLHFFSSQMAR